MLGPALRLLAIAPRAGTGGVFIKRIVGLPGERIVERSGCVFVNGAQLAEPYARAKLRDRRTVAPSRVPAPRDHPLGE